MEADDDREIIPTNDTMIALINLLYFNSVVSVGNLLKYLMIIYFVFYFAD